LTPEIWRLKAQSLQSAFGTPKEVPERVFSDGGIPPAAGSRHWLRGSYGTSGTRALPVRAGIGSFPQPL